MSFGMVAGGYTGKHCAVLIVFIAAFTLSTRVCTLWNMQYREASNDTGTHCGLAS